MISIQINNNLGFKWYQNDKITVKGYLFDQNNQLFKDNELLEFFNNIDNKKELKEELINANGIFTVIINKNDISWIANDRLRTFPLYYSYLNNELVISDTTKNIVDNNNFIIDEISIDEFLSAGYVSGRNTIYKNLYQTQAAEIIEVKNNKIYSEFYYDYTITKQKEYNFKDAETKFLQILDNITNRLILSAQNKTLVVPLSGGYDSRIIASMLKQKGYEKVICFTYGTKNSFEVPIAKKVAKKLGYTWHFIEYTNEIYKNFTKTNDFNNYVNLISNHSSVFLIQTYFAVKYLKDNKLIPNDSIMVTGISGDFLAGSQLPKNMNYSFNKHTDNNSKIVKEIFARKYVYKKPKFKKELINRIKEELINGFAYSLVENDFYKGKISKILVNSHRIHENFGYEHRLILWDNEIADFFKTIELKYKQQPFFYSEVLNSKIFEPMGISLVPEDKIKKNNIYIYFKALIKKFTPKSIVKFRNRLLAKNINNDKARNRELLNDLSTKEDTHAHVMLLSAKWYLEKYITKDNDAK